MKQPPRQRTIKDERDEKIGKDAKVYAFESSSLACNYRFAHMLLS